MNEEHKLYKYSYRYRGFSPGCQPKGYTSVEHNYGRFGAISYSRLLTTEELDEYELDYIGETVYPQS
jgi:hypothetical protein